MKIKISYSDNEKIKALEIEKILAGVFSNGQNLKIKKPQKSQPYHHTYMSVDKI